MDNATLFQIAVIVHADGKEFCWLKTGVSILEAPSRLPAKICHRHFYRRDRCSIYRTYFFFRKRNKNCAAAQEGGK